MVDEALVIGRQYFLWDRDLKGFGLKVSASGRKVYVVQYRLGGRGFPTKRHTIGAEGSPWNPSTARAEAKRVLHLVGLGQDPAAEAKERTRDQVQLRFDAFAQRFLEVYAKREWAERTFRTHESNVRRWLVPVLRSKPISQITRTDVTEVLDRLPPNSAALPRNVFVLLRKMLNWAVERGELPSSPISGMRVPRSAPERHHILADHELVSVAACAADLGPVWGSFVRMLILTGQRVREVAEANWSELSRAERLWTIPRERTKNGRVHTVPLSDLAIRELDERAGGDKWPVRGLVYSHRPNAPISGFSKMKRRFDRILCRVADPPPGPWRLHDLRRTVATNLQRLGARFEVTEAVLNHVSLTQAGVASVYQRHDWAEEKRAALSAWGERFLWMIDEWESAARQ